MISNDLLAVSIRYDLEEDALFLVLVGNINPTWSQIASH